MTDFEKRMKKQARSFAGRLRPARDTAQRIREEIVYQAGAQWGFAEAIRMLRDEDARWNGTEPNDAEYWADWLESQERGE